MLAPLGIDISPQARREIDRVGLSALPIRGAVYHLVRLQQRNTLGCALWVEVFPLADVTETPAKER